MSKETRQKASKGVIVFNNYTRRGELNILACESRQNEAS